MSGAFNLARFEMVKDQLQRRGIRDRRVLAAMGNVRRDLFVPAPEKDDAYADRALSLDCGQTISQPYIVALMTEALELTGAESVLEIGTGSGYAAAVLSRIAADVYTVERIGTLAEKSAAALADHGYSNIHVRHGDGTLGWAEH